MSVSQVPHSIEPGHRLFAQYAHAPNTLGYCGPAEAAALEAVACGAGDGVDVPGLARHFSGAWPYQQVLADLVQIPDPLDERVVRAYWTGNELTAAVDTTEFGEALLELIRPQAGHYWSHLTDDLLAEAAPTHAFHVLGVYPWSRLLCTGQPEPLQVLDSCRIAWAEVLVVEAESLVVRQRHLAYDAGILTLGEDTEERVGHRVPAGSLVGVVEPGDQVAVHWGFACDRLTKEQVESLERWTAHQLEAMAPRLAQG
ncbi:MAG: DUF6390 family protein [Marmoricola sp.]